MWDGGAGEKRGPGWLLGGEWNALRARRGVVGDRRDGRDRVRALGCACTLNARRIVHRAYCPSRRRRGRTKQEWVAKRIIAD